MMRKLKLLLLTIISLLSLDSFSAGRVETEEIILEGIVSDADNELAIGAEIVLKNTASGTEYQTVSGLDGSYSVKLRETGTYTINVEYTGFQPIRATITFTENDFAQIITRIFVLEYDSELLSAVHVVSSTNGTDAGARRLERGSSNVLNGIAAKQM